MSHPSRFKRGAIFGSTFTFAVIIFVVLAHFTVSECDVCTFRAAVYESAFRPSGFDPIQTMQANLDAFGVQAESAANQEANIIVFPEMGITGLDWDSSQDEYYQTISNVGTNPCLEDEGTNETLVPQSLSCMARENGIIVVANFATSVLCNVSKSVACPARGSYHYNTDAAFGEDGTILAIYHKLNLYGEPEFDRPPTVEHVYFDTPFGRFGLVTCFDILWMEPTVTLVEQYEVDSIAFPTAWMDQLPYLASVQSQAAWAAGFNINLLAANMHFPIGGFMGSGLYSGLRGPVDYVYTAEVNGQLIINDLPCKTSSNRTEAIAIGGPNIYDFRDDPVSYHYIKYEDLTEFIGAAFEEETGEIRLCQGSFCCGATYQLVLNSSSPPESGQYKLVIHRGNISEGDLYTYSAEICSVLWCGDDQLTSCTRQPANIVAAFASLELWGNFSTTYVYPSILMDNLQLALPDRWNYASASDRCDELVQNGTTCALVEITSTGDPLYVTAVSLYGRLYDSDDF